MGGGMTALDRDVAENKIHNPLISGTKFIDINFYDYIKEVMQK
jgi:hypothetical protein